MSKKMMWSLVAAVVIIAAIAVVMIKKSGNNIDMSAYPSGQQQSTDTTPNTSTTTGAAGNLSYNAALTKYGANRIQFNDTCQTTPNTVTYKSGTQVMFDNRSAASHTITFNGVKHTIAGYGFTVIGMTASKYPSTVLVDCDKSQNVATVLIQK